MTLIIVVHFPFPLNVEGSEMRGKCMLSATRLYWNWAPCSDRRSLRNFILYNYAVLVLWLDLYLIRFHFKRPLQPSTLCYHICVHTPIQHVKKKKVCMFYWLVQHGRFSAFKMESHFSPSRAAASCYEQRYPSVCWRGGCYPIPSDA